MTTVHPGAALTASPALIPSDSSQTVICPFCQAITACAPVAGHPLHPFPCPSCHANLLVLNPAAGPTDEESTRRSWDENLPVDLSRRLTGIAVAVLACVLNYVLLSAMAYWMLGQIKTTHDPYEIDGLVLSPFILKANGWTPLHLAAARGDLSAAAVLLAEGQAVDQRNGNGRTALFEAAKRGHSEMVTLLVQHGANPNGKGKQGLTPLLAAAEQGHAEAQCQLAAVIMQGQPPIGQKPPQGLLLIARVAQRVPHRGLLQDMLALLLAATPLVLRTARQ